MSAVTTAFTVCAGISLVLVLSPRPWHFESWNMGAVLYRFWTTLGVFNLFVNSIVWRNDAIVRAPVWCDISSRIILSVGIAIPITALCINRRLYHIAAGRKSGLNDSKRERRRAVTFDLFLSLGIPILYLPLAYVVQGHRFDIFEELGCYPYLHPTVPTLFIASVTPLVIALISVSYAVRTIIIFRRRRLQIDDMLSSTNLTSSGYFRLTAFAGAEVVICLPMTIYGLALNASNGVYPYVSWEDVHWGFSRIDSVPSILWRNFSTPGAIVALETTRWSTILCAVAFFGFYGFTQESRRLYKEDAYRIARWLRLVESGPRSPDQHYSTSSKPSTLPISFRRTLPLDTLDTLHTTRTSICSSMAPSTLPSPVAT